MPRPGSGAEFRSLLAGPGVTETVTLGSPIGLMAFHGGTLERHTEQVAERVAAITGASLYRMCQTDPDPIHIPSHLIGPEASEALGLFLDHVDVAVAIHGYGRPELHRSILLGGSNRQLAEHLAVQMIPALGHYEIITDLDLIPRELRGLHPRNPVNRPRHGGVQIELPPRVRGMSPILWGPRPPTWTGPHLDALVAALARGVRAWSAGGKDSRSPINR
ncbi:MAG TPA: hypothetical protein ENI86_09860 [Acidimicrobiales bacterium]|nr:hypothetical protein [Acidimicrobiales bacterium]